MNSRCTYHMYKESDFSRDNEACKVQCKWSIRLKIFDNWEIVLQVKYVIKLNKNLFFNQHV